MGKQVEMSRASAKIAKHGAKKRQGMMGCSLMKMLKPKVYITDTSNFKRLIQELTGNGDLLQPTPNARFPSPPPCDTATVSSDTVSRSEETRVLEDLEEVLFGEDATSGCFTGTLPILEPEWNLQQVLMQRPQQQVDDYEKSNFRDIETWLLDMESVPSSESYIPEVSIYDSITGDL